MSRVLIVDDEVHVRRILAAMLRESGHDVREASGLSDARTALEGGTLDVVITDHRMSDGDGLAVLASSAEADPALPVVVLTAFASIELAVDAMRRGAFDFITKPFQAETVRAAVRRAQERVDLLRENGRLRNEVQRLGAAAELVGSSRGMQALREHILRVAPTNATVLVTGETGTGKELVARAIHCASARAAGPFVPVNCAALPETLLESELFGHERGAFTGADRARPGLFEAADRGTLFLDEAGEMPLAVQVKLLRVLADGHILRVGARTPRQVNVRIVVATHRDLKSRVAEGVFREDLYYRIAVVPIEIPPLRDRREDIPALVAYFVEKVAHDLKLPRRSVAPEAVKLLAEYSFPGNIRELRNLIERAYILARHPDLEPEDFPVSPGGEDAPALVGDGESADLARFVNALPSAFPLRSTIEALERQCLARALQNAAGVQAEAARALGLSRSDMAYRVRKYRLQQETCPPT